MLSVPDHDLRRREQWIVETPKLLAPQVVDPVDNYLADIVADRKEPCRERLRELRLHLPRVLVDPALLDVDMSELEGGGGAVAGAGQDREGDKGSVAAFNVGGEG